MDEFEQYLDEIHDSSPALVEAVLAAYKICHQSEPDGNSDFASGFTISDDGLFFQRQPDTYLLGRANVPSLLNHPQGFASPIAGPSRLHDSNNSNIVMEGRNGNRNIKKIDARIVYQRVIDILHQLSSGDLSDELKERYNAVLQCTVNDVSIAGFNLLAFAVDNEPMQDSVLRSFYRNIINGRMVTEFRIADHYTVISRKFKGKKRTNPKAQQHTSVNLHDVAKTQALGKHKQNIGEGKPGAQFDSSDTRIGIVEITFDMVKFKISVSPSKIVKDVYNALDVAFYISRAKNNTMIGYVQTTRKSRLWNTHLRKNAFFPKKKNFSALSCAF